MDQDMGGVKPKAPFYIVVILMILGLVGYAAYRADIIAPKGKNNAMPTMTKEDMAKLQPKVESPDSGAPTTVKEYKFISSEKLPPVTGVAGFRKLENDTVRFALNIWAGWAPIIYANDGFKAKKEWTSPDGKKFKVELVLLDDPVAMRNAYAVGIIEIVCYLDPFLTAGRKVKNFSNYKCWNWWIGIWAKDRGISAAVSGHCNIIYATLEFLAVTISIPSAQLLSGHVEFQDCAGIVRAREQECLLFRERQPVMTAAVRVI